MVPSVELFGDPGEFTGPDRVPLFSVTGEQMAEWVSADRMPSLSTHRHGPVRHSHQLPVGILEHTHTVVSPPPTMRLR